MLRAVLLVAVVSADLAAQPVRGRLPLEAFSAAQGLPNDSITAFTRDSRGFLWIATLDGLARYDGRQFVNYLTTDGLPHRMVWSIAEDRRGAMWIGTDGGIVRLDPDATRGPQLFEKIEPGIDASGVFIDRSGNVWSSCELTLCRVQNGRLIEEEAFKKNGGSIVRTMAEDARGSVWFGSEQGLLRRTAQGTWSRHAVHPHRGGDIIHGILHDPDGRMWLSTGFGVIVAWPEDLNGQALIDRAKVILPGDAFQAPKRGEVVAILTSSQSPVITCRTPYRTADGTVWVPSYVGLFRIREPRVDLLDGTDGLPPIEITAVGEDPAGDVWIGTRGAGALRLARHGATTFTRAHGLANGRIMSLFGLDDGAVCATNPIGLSCFRGDEIQHASLWPKGTRFFGWGWNQILAADAERTWWFATGEGLVRWPRVSRLEQLQHMQPMKVYTERDGLAAIDIFRVWIDSQQRLWVATFGIEPLSMKARDSDRFVSFGKKDGFPLATPSAFAEDRDGNVWIGLYAGGLVRTRDGRTFEALRENIPSSFVRDLRVDSKGRLWIAATGGVARIENPTADLHALQITRLTRRDGLSSDSGYCVVEMPDGRIAIGSQRGLDVLDPGGGKAVHLTMREGLAGNEVSVAMADRSGALWLGTVNGLSRLSRIPRPRVVPPPQPRILGIQIDGVPVPVAELGTSSLKHVRIAYPRHAMAVRVGAPHFDPGRSLRFEFRLNGRWTDAGSQGVIVFDGLPAGDGVIELRAVTEDGAASTPARVAFRVVPPLWKQTWFLVLAVMILAAIVLAVHRYRLAQAVALERVRTRVATDLHDDLGSSLSRISLLSEIAKGEREEPILDEIADSARGLIDTLGDNIWAIDPRRDNVRSLLLRARHFGAAVFEPRSIAIDVQVPDDVGAIPLSPEQRRETYLILKEALNNAAKHADAKQIEVLARADGALLRIEVRDDGRGFVDARDEREDGGRGVASMRSRAERVGGRVDIASAPGRGTTVSVAVPL